MAPKRVKGGEILIDLTDTYRFECHIYLKCWLKMFNFKILRFQDAKNLKHILEREKNYKLSVKSFSGRPYFNVENEMKEIKVISIQN